MSAAQCPALAESQFIRYADGCASSPQFMPHNFQLSLAFGSLLLVGTGGVWLLIAFHQQGPPNRLGRWARRFGTAWEFTPVSIGGFSWSHLALASLLSLFLEMLLIRWIAAEVSAFAYFKNIVLVACFLGFGLGCYLSRKPIDLLAFLLPFSLLVSVVKLPWPALRNVIREIPYLIAPSSEMTLLGTPNVPVNFAGTLSAILIIVLLFALVA